MISEEYREQNKVLHQTRPTYGKSGHKWVDKALAVSVLIKPSEVLDYGCGKGTFGREWRARSGVELFEYDPAIQGKDKLPCGAELVVCTDVLEHVEPDYIKEVINHLYRLTGKALLLTIATRPAKKSLSDGRNAHLIIKDKVWWLSELRPWFDVFFLSEDLTEEGEIFAVLTPRH